MIKNKKAKLQHIHRHFRKVDPAIFDILKKMKLEILPKEQDAARYFPQLCREIISQQLAGKAAHAIHQRFVKLFPGGKMTPRKILAVSEKEFRAIGMSWAKARYVRDLAQKVATKQVNLKNLHHLDDEAVMAELIKVKGIGRWTADMFLMFRLHRPDVLPVGDLGIVKAVQKNYGLRKIPTAKRIVTIGEAWRPYRSIACWYLWASLDNTPAKN